MTSSKFIYLNEKFIFLTKFLFVKVTMLLKYYEIKKIHQLIRKQKI